MKKSTIIVVAVAIVVVAILAVMFFAKKDASNLPAITSDEDLVTLADSIYAGITDEMPGVMSQPIDLANTDADTINYMTGLENGDDLEYLLVSEPMMSSQAYSMVIAKVKSGVNANKVAETMKTNINTRKWICVAAEKLYATNSGDVVFLVMTKADLAQSIFNSFKTLAGNTGKVFERTEQEAELPSDMY